MGGGKNIIFWGKYIPVISKDNKDNRIIIDDFESSITGFSSFKPKLKKLNRHLINFITNHQENLENII